MHWKTIGARRATSMPFWDPWSPMAKATTVFPGKGLPQTTQSKNSDNRSKQTVPALKTPECCHFSVQICRVGGFPGGNGKGDVRLGAARALRARCAGTAPTPTRACASSGCAACAGVSGATHGMLPCRRSPRMVLRGPPAIPVGRLLGHIGVWLVDLCSFLGAWPDV